MLWFLSLLQFPVTPAGKDLAVHVRERDPGSGKVRHLQLQGAQRAIMAAGVTETTEWWVDQYGQTVMTNMQQQQNVTMHNISQLQAAVANENGPVYESAQEAGRQQQTRIIATDDAKISSDSSADLWQQTSNVSSYTAPGSRRTPSLRRQTLFDAFPVASPDGAAGHQAACEPWISNDSKTDGTSLHTMITADASSSPYHDNIGSHVSSSTRASSIEQWLDPLHEMSSTVNLSQRNPLRVHLLLGERSKQRVWNTIQLWDPNQRVVLHDGRPDGADVIVVSKTRLKTDAKVSNHMAWR